MKLSLIYVIIKSGILFFCFTSFFTGIQGNDNDECKHKCNHLVSGVILDKKTQTPIGKIGVALLDEKKEQLKRVFSDRSGRFDFGVVSCKTRFFIKVENKSYETEQMELEIPEKSYIIERKFELTSN
jgi:hypothetical protein